MRGLNCLLCVLCGWRKRRFRSQLCHACWMNKENRLMVGEFPKVIGGPGTSGSMVAPKEPTTALAGSAEKIEVMRQRVARGETCFHPLDCREMCENKGFLGSGVQEIENVGHLNAEN